MNTTKPHRRLGKVLFWVSVIISGIVGLKFTGRLAYQILMDVPFIAYRWPAWRVVIQMLVASISFLALYGLLALNLVMTMEKKYGVEIYKPSIKRGMIYSALIPFILGIIAFLLILLLAHSGMHDSM